MRLRIGCVRAWATAVLLLGGGLRLSAENVPNKIPPWLYRTCQAVSEALQPQLDPYGNPLPLPPLSSCSTGLVRVDDQGFIQVSLETNGAVTPGVLLQLQNLGFREELRIDDAGLLQGWLPFNQIEQAAALAELRRVAPPAYLACAAGSVTSEGDRIHRANRTRNETGVTGRGVRVGVISDGADSMAASIATGDLPANVQRLMLGAGDEGTAMLEIVHDLAPGATLFFAGAATNLELILAIQALFNAGCDIICDDLISFQDPYFEDSLLAQTAQAVVDAGAFYCSSANNHAQRHYQNRFRTGGARAVGNAPAINLTDVHLFAEGDFRGGISLPANEQVTIVLQWNDRWGQSGNNYDLFLFNGDVLLQASQTVQDGDDFPIEVITFITAQEYANADIVIDKVAGADRVLEFFLVDPDWGRITDENARVPRDSIIGQQAARGVFAVGAIDAADPGNNSVEDFSGRGPSTLYFPWESREKPQACGIDGVTVTGVGGFGSPFFGTSAASPHAAALAALVLSVKPNLTPAQLAYVLQATAVDIEWPGFDRLSGSGRLDAYAAVKSLAPSVLSLTLSATELETTSAGIAIPLVGTVVLDFAPLFDAVVVQLLTSNPLVAALATNFLTFNVGENQKVFNLSAISGGPPVEAVVSAVGGGTTQSVTVRVGPTSSSASSGGACFVATAAYGRALEHPVRALSRARDQHLLRAELGRAFTRTYTANTPVPSRVLRTSAFLRACVREALSPLAQTVQASADPRP